MSYPPPGDPNQPPQYPSGQPPQYPANQPPQYQSQPYGTPYPTDASSGYGYGGYTPHMERPGTVTAACVITFVMSGIGFALSALMVVFFGPMWSSVEEDPDTYNLTQSEIDDYSDVHGAIAGVFGVLMVLAVVAIVLAVFVMRGSNAARITLVVIGSVTGLAVIITIFGIVWTLAIVATIICLFVGGSNDWFRYRSEQRRQGV